MCFEQINKIHKDRSILPRSSKCIFLSSSTSQHSPFQKDELGAGTAHRYPLAAWLPASHTTGARQCSCSWTDSTSTGIYGYIWIFFSGRYIYISQKKLYVQKLAFIRVSLALTGTGMCWWGGTKQRRGQSRAATSTRAVIKYFRMGNAMFVTKMIQY